MHEEVSFVYLCQFSEAETSNFSTFPIRVQPVRPCNLRPFEVPDFVTEDLPPFLLKRVKAAEGSGHSGPGSVFFFDPPN